MPARVHNLGAEALGAEASGGGGGGMSPGDPVRTPYSPHPSQSWLAAIWLLHGALELVCLMPLIGAWEWLRSIVTQLLCVSVHSTIIGGGFLKEASPNKLLEFPIWMIAFLGLGECFPKPQTGPENQKMCLKNLTKF